jgi:hypothetical protein
MSVSFVNGGKSFFDCSEAEARKAIDYIAELRKNATLVPETEEIRQNIRRILNARDQAEVRGMVIHGHFRVKNVADVMEVMEKHDVRVSHLLMSAEVYSGMRRWDRDALDIETQASRLKAGLMASVFGADIIVSKECVGTTTHSLIVASLDEVNPVFHEYKITFLPPEMIGNTTEDELVKQLEGLILQIRNR